MRDFKRIQAWQKSHQLALNIYRLSGNLPQTEKYGITKQLQRATISIPANIAEGFGRETEKELSRFIDIALGLACETEYYLLLLRDLNYIDEDVYERLNKDLIEVKKMLYSYNASIRKKLKADH